MPRAGVVNFSAAALYQTVDNTQINIAYRSNFLAFVKSGDYIHNRRAEHPPPSIQ